MIWALRFIGVRMAATLSDQTILIVEDQDGPRRALMMILSSFYQIHTAETASAGLKIIVDRPIDLVILDVGLPDYSGIELLRRVRASGRNVKAIVMSGGASIESAEEVLRLGAVAYLLKPFSFQELLTLVENALKVKDTKLS
jgi:putative two-component system response regulator